MRSRIDRVCVWLLILILPTILLSCSGGGGGGGGSTDTGTTNVATDTAPPALVSTTPTGTTNVSVNSLFCATFSEKLEPLSLSGSNIHIAGVEANLSSKCSSVCLNPTSDLTYSTSYTLTIDGVTDIAGNVLASPYSFTFITSSPVKAIAAGFTHTIALKTDGTVWTWGSNEFGKLGDGTTTQRTTPVQVNGLTNVAAIAGGYSHTIALKTDGTVWTWGNNNDGQLGDGTQTQRTSPVQIIGLTNVKAIAAGYYLTADIMYQHSHSLALKNDGTVWTWGDNAYGQLGDGTTTQSSTPVQASGLTTVSAIAGGYGRSFALKNNGTLWVWGDQRTGTVCAGCAPVDFTLPRQIQADVPDISAIAASGHGVALKIDGTLKTWGYQSFDGAGTIGITGLGDGTITNVSAVAAGNTYTIALKNDGTVWTWGSNNYGQLGDGTLDSSDAPVKAIFSTSVSAAPAALAGVTATAGISKMTVSWDTTPGATSYDIYYSTSSAVNTTTGTEVECVTSPYTITNLTPGIPYYTCVVASNGYGNSACSNIATATPADVPPPPPPPPTSGSCPSENKCHTISGGIEWMGAWYSKQCSCPSGMIDQGGSYINSLCGLSGTGTGCKYCDCP